MAHMLRSAGSVKGHMRRGRGGGGIGRGRGIGRPPKEFSRSPKVFSSPQLVERVEPKTFPEMLDLKPVAPIQVVTAPVPLGQKQKARKSFRPMELPKRLLSPLEQTMPDPKRIKVKATQGNRSENHIQ